MGDRCSICGAKGGDIDKYSFTAKQGKAEMRLMYCEDCDDYTCIEVWKTTHKVKRNGEN